MLLAATVTKDSPRKLALQNRTALVLSGWCRVFLDERAVAQQGLEVGNGANDPEAWILEQAWSRKRSVVQRVAGWRTCEQYEWHRRSVMAVEDPGRF